MWTLSGSLVYKTFGILVTVVQIYCNSCYLVWVSAGGSQARGLGARCRAVKPGAGRTEVYSVPRRTLAGSSLRSTSGGAPTPLVPSQESSATPSPAPSGSLWSGPRSVLQEVSQLWEKHSPSETTNGNSAHPHYFYSLQSNHNKMLLLI